MLDEIFGAAPNALNAQRQIAGQEQLALQQQIAAQRALPDKMPDLDLSQSSPVPGWDHAAIERLARVYFGTAADLPIYWLRDADEAHRVTQSYDSLMTSASVTAIGPSIIQSRFRSEQHLWQGQRFPSGYTIPLRAIGFAGLRGQQWAGARVSRPTPSFPGLPPGQKKHAYQQAQFGDRRSEFVRERSDTACRPCFCSGIKLLDRIASLVSDQTC